MPQNQSPPSRLTLPASLSLVAASGDAKPSKLAILAYSGGEMHVAGWGAVAIDLANLETPDNFPILDGHANALASVIGAGLAESDGKSLTVSAKLADTDAARQVVALLKAGVALQASVGVQPSETSYVESGDSITINGRTLEAGRDGLRVVRAGSLREVSILPLGADSATFVSLAAKPQGTNSTMSKPVVPVVESPDPIQAERSRIAEIDTLARDYPEVRAAAIRDGLTVEQCKARVLDELRASRASINSIAGGRASSGVDPEMALTAAAMQLAGRGEASAKTLGERAANAGADLKARSLLDIAAAALRLDGREVPRDTNALIRASFSTMSLPVALGNTVGRVAEQAYRDAVATWRMFSKIVPLSDFKQANIIRVTPDGELLKVGGDGEVKSSGISEETRAIQLDTWGRMISVTRQDVVNDDRGFLADIPTRFGVLAARTISNEVWRAILADLPTNAGAGTHWTAARGNKNTGGDSTLGLGGLTEAVKLMRRQTDSLGGAIDLTPTTIVVPPELEMAAAAVLNSTQISRDAAVDQLPMGNPFSSRNIALGVEPRISNSNYTGYNAAGWWLFAAAGDGAVNVGGLNGAPSIVVEQGDAPPNVLGVWFRVYCDFAVGLGDYRASVYSAGS